MDIKLQSNVVNDIDSYCVVRDELIIYREYENV
nr:MAG TPA: Sporulation protein Cse60 [Bacteriophage sp.]